MSVTRGPRPSRPPSGTRLALAGCTFSLPAVRPWHGAQTRRPREGRAPAPGHTGSRAPGARILSQAPLLTLVLRASSTWPLPRFSCKLLEPTPRMGTLSSSVTWRCLITEKPLTPVLSQPGGPGPPQLHRARSWLARTRTHAQHPVCPPPVPVCQMGRRDALGWGGARACLTGTGPLGLLRGASVWEVSSGPCAQPAAPGRAARRSPRGLWKVLEPPPWAGLAEPWRSVATGASG